MKEGPGQSSQEMSIDKLWISLDVSTISLVENKLQVEVWPVVLKYEIFKKITYF